MRHIYLVLVIVITVGACAGPDATDGSTASAAQDSCVYCNHVGGADEAAFAQALIDWQDSCVAYWFRYCDSCRREQAICAWGDGPLEVHESYFRTTMCAIPECSLHPISVIRAATEWKRCLAAAPDYPGRCEMDRSGCEEPVVVELNQCEGDPPYPPM
jgi:hypothetical protein